RPAGARTGPSERESALVRRGPARDRAGLRGQRGGRLAAVARAGPDDAPLLPREAPGVPRAVRRASRVVGRRPAGAEARDRAARPWLCPAGTHGRGGRADHLERGRGDPARPLAPLPAARAAGIRVSGTIYCFDTSAWVHAWVRAYPPTSFPGLWAELGRLVAAGRLLSPD